MIKIGENISLPDFPLLLAPMEDVSDPPFRAVCKDHGADLMYTEFISSEGLIRDAIKSRKKLDIFDYEKPVGIQIFGGDEESLSLAAKIVDVTNPDLLDMVRLTDAVVKSTSLPVTVKTRLGWDDNNRNIEEVAERLQDVGIKALAIHGRTRAQMYKGEADWTLIAKVKNNPRIKIPIFGNGDIDSPEKALDYKNRFGVDGIMIGRAAIGYPWIFNEIKHFVKTGEHLAPPTIEDRVAVCKKHLHKSFEWKGPKVGIFEMRRHYTNYLKGMPGIKDYRYKLVTLDTVEEIDAILDEIAIKYQGYAFEKTPIELINYHEKCPVI
jgi:tRNA-dihydrouridine synthase B